MFLVVVVVVVRVVMVVGVVVRMMVMLTMVTTCGVSAAAICGSHPAIEAALVHARPKIRMRTPPSHGYPLLGIACPVSTEQEN